VWFQYDPVTETWAEQTPIRGQIYTPQRTQDDENGGLIFFMYPKESNLLRDAYDYDDRGRADVIAIDYPTGNILKRLCRVREVQPRWLRFPNEHLLASLERLTAYETAIVNDGGGGVLQFPPYRTRIDIVTDEGLLKLPVAEAEGEPSYELIQVSEPTMTKRVRWWASSTDGYPAIPAPELFEPDQPILTRKVRKPDPVNGVYRIAGEYTYPLGEEVPYVPPPHPDEEEE